jgi:NADH dehydrogenase FAD-containing subunit
MLVDPDRFWYSGLATGMLGGMYEPAADQVDAARLIESRGGRFVRDRVTALDRQARLAFLESGRQLAYDAVSFNVGSEVAFAHVSGADRHAWPVKPTSNLWRLRQHLEALFRSGRAVTRVGVAGGGASGCEVAANIDALARRHGGRAEVMLISRSGRLMNRHPRRVSRKVEALLQRLGIMIVRGCSVDEAHAGRLVCSDGQRPEYDVLVVATGLQAPELIGGLGLARGAKGGLLVGGTLQSADEPRAVPSPVTRSPSGA